MSIIALPASLPIRRIAWTLDRPAQVNRSAYTGARRVVANPWHGMWKAHVELATQQGEANIRQWRAVLAKLKGQINTLRLPATEGAQVSGTLLGVELVTNGTFTTDTSGWAAGNAAGLSVVGNRLRVTIVSSTYGGCALQSVPTVIGQTYQVSANTFQGTAGANLREVMIGTSTAGTDYGLFTDSDVNAVTFVATTTTTWITLLINSSTNGDFADFDNVTMKRVVAQVQLTASAAQGASSFAISTNPGLVEGMLMTALMPSGNEQLLLITSVSGSTIGFEPPLRETMALGASVEITNPTALVALADSEFGWSVEQWRRYGIVFDVEEAF